MPTLTASTAQTVLLVSVAVFLVTGLISFGWLLIYGLRKWREEQNPPTEQPAQSPKPEAAAAPTPNANPAAPVLNAVGDFFKRASSGGGGQASAPGAHEVLRVARDNLTGRLLVEMAGQRFAKLSDVQDAQLAQAILTTLRDLQEFAGAPTTTPTVAPLPSSHTSPPVTVAPIPTPLVMQAAPPPRPAVPTTSAEMPPIPKPSMNPFKQAQVLRERAKQLEPIQLKSIPEIIDEYLQQKLLSTPYTRRGIRVSGNAQGAVVFEIDGRMYDAVDAVPDADARNLIKSAIAEWDAKK